MDALDTWLWQRPVEDQRTHFECEACGTIKPLGRQKQRKYCNASCQMKDWVKNHPGYYSNPVKRARGTKNDQ